MVLDDHADTAPLVQWRSIPGLLLLIVVLCGVCIPLDAAYGPLAFLLMVPTLVIAVWITRWLRKRFPEKP